jgi:trk system potassium uptake protein TrkA
LDFDVLKEANAAATETAVCVTDDDKVNVLAALLAKRQGAKRAMALLNNMTHASFVSSLGVDAIINPKSITVSTILQHIRQGRIRAIYAIRNDFAELIDAEARETSLAVGLSMVDINIDGQIFVAALVRNGAIQFLPSPGTFIRIDDRLIIISTKASIKKIEKLFALRSGYI